ncbi:hypothetical protein L1049_025767 [Liquidambar formosana]|uniref:Uncharacterized protein n=1 Tax=Liquidambar formosana TaxID=63359 RepID=A0AAP0NDF1_LIQFO
MGPTADGGSDASNEVATGKSVPQLALHLLREQCSLSFPRRVFVPWLMGTFICDYLQPSETLEVLKDHIVELMSMEAPTDATTILEPEIEAPTVATKSFGDVANLCPAASSSDYPPLKKGDIDATRKESERKSIKSERMVFQGGKSPSRWIEVTSHQLYKNGFFLMWH